MWQVAVAVADPLVPMITEVTPVNERMSTRLRISHTLGVISVVFLYAPTWVSEFYVEEAFYAQSIAGSWFKRPELHRWTCFSNNGGAGKEIDHVLVGGR